MLKSENAQERKCSRAKVLKGEGAQERRCSGAKMLKSGEGERHQAKLASWRCRLSG
jgi:hypothetical protein